jgi:hypothetical protein
MLKHIVNTCIFISALLGLSSCQKVIDIELDTAPDQIVIEGNITDQLGVQSIKISQSVPYTESNHYPAVRGATVIVKDEKGQSWNFTETQPGTYTSGPLKGEAGGIYTLVVTAHDGAIYTASSAMPKPVILDSLSFKVYDFFGDETKEVQVSYKDPVDASNQYRYLMKVNGTAVKQIFVDNDRFTNGKGGERPLFYSAENEKDKLKKGDQVEIEMQCIDQQMFTYWYTLSRQAESGPGGGVTPGNPPSNISNGALGYFSVHTTQVKTINIK